MPATEFAFTLPIGIADAQGSILRDGIMRQAITADEILPFRDSRVQENPAYLPVIVLARVLVKLGNENVTTRTIEGLTVTDFHFLRQFYKEINQYPADKEAFRLCSEDMKFKSDENK
jgi:hypothetical protein